MRLIHVGTFDVANYGDLLFPLVLEQRLAGVADEIVFVSPAGGPPVLSDSKPTLSIEEFDDSTADVAGVVLGGGHLLHAGPPGVAKYRRDDLGYLLTYPRLCAFAAGLAADAGAPLCLNAVGVVGPASPAAARLTTWIASQAAYVTVRDRASMRFLRQAGVDEEIAVVVDSGLGVADLWSREELSQAYENAFRTRGREVPERPSLAIHLTSRFASEEVAVLAQRIGRMASAGDHVPVLIALGRCHRDDEIQRAVAQAIGSDCLLVDEPGSLKEVAALIGGAEAYIGSSLHGMVTACALGTRGALVADQMHKFVGFLEQFGLSRWLLSSWAEAEAALGDLLTVPIDPWAAVGPAAKPVLDRHWSRIRSEIQAVSRRSAGTGLHRPERSAEPLVQSLLDGLLPEMVQAELERSTLGARQQAQARRDSQEALKARAAQLAAALEAMTAERDAVRPERERVVDELELARSELGELRDRLTERADAVAAAQRELDARAGQLVEARGLLEAGRDIAQQQAEHRGELERELSEAVGAVAEAERLREQIAEVQEQAREEGALFRADRAAALSEAERARGALEVAETARQEAEALATATDAALDQSNRSLDAVAAQLGAYEERIETLDAAIGQEAEHRAAAERETGRLRAVLADRDRRLVETRDTLAELKDDVRRVADSRAWRIGHWLTRLGRRLMFRRIVSRGAPARMLERLERANHEASDEGALLRGDRDAALSEGGHARASLEAGKTPREDAGAPAASGDPALDQLNHDYELLVASPSGRSGGAADGPGAPHRESYVEQRIGAGPLSSARFRGENLAATLRQRFGAVPELDDCPSVSIVVLNRNGVAYLRALVEGLVSRTDYPEFELIVVDNASADASVEFLRRCDTAFPIQVIENGRNLPFSDANNQGAARAEGRLLLFMNNDVEPIEPGWLKEMVATRAKTGAAAVGAVLVYGERRFSTASGWSIQHRGIRFRNEAGLIRAYNVGGGEDPLEGTCLPDAQCPAVTAACLLIDRVDFADVGGFTVGYRYGTEDVDLGLKLLASGRRSTCCGRAVLLHDESPTQDAEGREFMRMNRLANRDLFQGRWGPQLRREYLLDALTVGSFWSELSGLHAGVTLTSKLASDGWGDWYTAHEIGDALEARGWRVSYLERKGEAWYSPPSDLDVTLCLLDPFDVSRTKSTINVAWIRNWTERWLSHPWFDALDVVVVSSDRSAEFVRADGRQAVAALMPLATNAARFDPREPEPQFACDYVFTGNFWGQRRDVIDALEVREGERFRVYGRGWDQVPEVESFWRGESAYADLARIYSSAALVIDDTAGPTLPYGAVNCRVFDALACGALVLTNCVEGARELFDDDFPTWSSREELRAQLDKFLAAPDLRRELADRYRSTVLARHTYQRRAEDLSELLHEHITRLRYCIKIGAPNQEVAERWGDLHFARAVAKQLRRRGLSCTIQTLDEWDSLEGLTYDVVLHLKGLSPYRPKPGQLNILWVISHPEKVTPEECDAYDLVCLASERFTVSLGDQTDTPVICLQQATDPDIFYPDASGEHEHDLVFVGNSRKVRRRILSDLLPTDHDLAVFGGDWDGLLDPRLVAAEFVPNEQVRHIYSSAAIVLNDHWDDMRRHGFVSNRVYDALACGAFIVSDHVNELEELFEDAVVTYRTREELAALIERFLSAPDERRERARRGRKLVLSRHTFSHRVDRLLEEVEELVRGGRFKSRIEPTSESSRETVGVGQRIATWNGR